MEKGQKLSLGLAAAGAGLLTYGLLKGQQPDDVFLVISDIDVWPHEVRPSDPLSVYVMVKNKGISSGKITVKLYLDGVLIDSEVVTRAAGEERPIVFTIVAPAEEGAHTVTAGDLQEGFDVSSDAPPPGEAHFKVDNLNIEPPRTILGLEIAIRVHVTNIGTAAGFYEVTLNIDGEVIETKATRNLSPGGGTTVSFYVTLPLGVHSVEIDDLSGTCEVVSEPTEAYVISRLTAAPAIVFSNEPIEVSFRVTNTGGVETAFEVPISLNDTVIKHESTVWLEPGNYSDESAIIKISGTGLYTIGVDGQEVQVAVMQWDYPELTTDLPVALRDITVQHFWTEPYNGWDGLIATIDLVVGSILEESVEVNFRNVGLQYGKTGLDFWCEAPPVNLIIPPGDTTLTFLCYAKEKFMFKSPKRFERYYNARLLLGQPATELNLKVRCDTKLVTPYPTGGGYYDDWGIWHLYTTESEYKLSKPEELIADELPSGVQGNITDIRFPYTGAILPGHKYPVEIDVEINFWKDSAPPTIEVSPKLYVFWMEGDERHSRYNTKKIIQSNCDVGLHTIVVDIAAPSPDYPGSVVGHAVTDKASFVVRRESKSYESWQDELFVLNI